MNFLIRCFKTMDLFLLLFLFDVLLPNFFLFFNCKTRLDATRPFQEFKFMLFILNSLDVEGPVVSLT